MTSLQLVFEAIQRIEDKGEMRSQLSPKIGAYFTAKRSAIFFFDQLKADSRFQPILDAALSVERNPVVRYVTERHTPVHEGMVTTPKAWKLICPRADHWHVMAGPIIERGQIVGSVGCTREKAMPAFEAQDVADLSAICLHLSVHTTALRTATAAQQQTFICDKLTPRELEIASLVALGRTNAEIGTELWITENSVKQALKRMFRKLKVVSRTEMAAQLFASQQRL
ncbi:MAG: helix-turn-helix transcriptional regulator [Phormidesmis sp.]